MKVETPEPASLHQHFCIMAIGKHRRESGQYGHHGQRADPWYWNLTAALMSSFLSTVRDSPSVCQNLFVNHHGWTGSDTSQNF